MAKGLLDQNEFDLPEAGFGDSGYGSDILPPPATTRAPAMPKAAPPPTSPLGLPEPAAAPPVPQQPPPSGLIGGLQGFKQQINTPQPPAPGPGTTPPPTPPPQTPEQQLQNQLYTQVEQPRTYADYSDAELRELYRRYSAAGYHGPGSEFGGVYFRNWVDLLPQQKNAKQSDIPLFKTVQQANQGAQDTLRQSQYDQATQRLEQTAAHGGRDAEEELLATLGSRGLLDSGIAARELERFRSEKFANLSEASSRLNELLYSNASEDLRREAIARLGAELQRANQESLLRLQYSLQQQLYNQQHSNDFMGFLGDIFGTGAGLITNPVGTGANLVTRALGGGEGSGITGDFGIDDPGDVFNPYEVSV